MQRLDILIGGLAVKFCHTATRRRIIADEAAVVLGTVQLQHIDGLRIRTPGDVREIARPTPGPSLLREGSFQVDGLIRLQVIDADGYLVARHAGHRVLVGLVCCCSGEDVNLRVVGDHALVHAVESQALAVGTPECAFVDAPLVAVDSLAIDNLTRTVCSQLVLMTFTVADIELMILQVGRSLGNAVPVVGLRLGDAVLPDNPLILEIHQDDGLSVAHHHQRFVGIGEGCVHQVAHIPYAIIALSPTVDVVEREEPLLFSRLDINGVTLLHIRLYQLVTPPRKPYILGLHGVVVCTTEVQVF